MGDLDIHFQDHLAILDLGQDHVAVQGLKLAQLGRCTAINEYDVFID